MLPNHSMYCMYTASPEHDHAPCSCHVAGVDSGVVLWSHSTETDGQREEERSKLVDACMDLERHVLAGDSYVPAPSLAGHVWRRSQSGAFHVTWLVAVGSVAGSGAVAVASGTGYNTYYYVISSACLSACPARGILGGSTRSRLEPIRHGWVFIFNFLLSRIPRLPVFFSWRGGYPVTLSSHPTNSSGFPPRVKRWRMADGRMAIGIPQVGQDPR